MELRVNISDYKVVKSPDSLITIGLGSCIGIVVYDSDAKIMGMAHIMLPKRSDYISSSNPLKFADTCIPMMVEEMIEKGANRNRLKAKIAGGANMFKNVSMEHMGKKNLKEVEITLDKLNIPIEARDVGGYKGRTLIAEADNARIYSRTVGMEKKLL